MKKIQQNLSGNCENHILPFLWIHGETPERMRQEIKHIYDSGIRALCVEARPHIDFNGPKWFEDIGVILDECRMRGMKMWLLDDSHFPTGYANGEVEKNYPQLCKKYLCLKSYDFVGPIKGSGLNLQYAMKSAEDEILGVFLQRRIGFEEICAEETIDLTANVKYVVDFNTGKPDYDMAGRPLPGIQGKKPIVYFDLPEGDWVLNVLTVSYKGGEKETEGYLNPIIPEATDVLLRTVYEPVYERFQDEFGKTFMGFFSDEPRFGNLHGAENALIGRNSDMVLLWRDDMLQLLTEKCGKLGSMLNYLTVEKVRIRLPYLFLSKNEEADALRYAYMDLSSELYREHFDKRIADWCHSHGCEHIGHCIEDNGAGSRLGYGAGHIFRAMENADMAGIDVVIHQLLPGEDKGMYKGMHSPGWDGEFFTYLLGKLGGSLAHLDVKKRGRCMCELFGAYGWAEGNRLKKWIADHMMVRGVNYLVPHAFDCASFPDHDCPPHFHADGHNPQYPEFRILMEYCNRICSLLSDGNAIPDVALYYNAEGEWGGEYQPTEKVASVLARNLIDYDLISADYIEMAKAEDGILKCGNLAAKALVLPWAEVLPKKLAENVLRIAKAGVPVYMVEDLPDRCTDSKQNPWNMEDGIIRIVALDNLASLLQQEQIAELRLDCREPYLRYYHYSQEDGEIYYFVNESPSKCVQCRVFGAAEGNLYEYDAFENKITANMDAFTLKLEPYESKIVLVTDEEMICTDQKQRTVSELREIRLDKCTVEIAPMEELVDGSAIVYHLCEGLNKPAYISDIQGFETFSGRVRYIFKVVLSAKEAEKVASIKLYGVREAATVTVNGTDCGTRICPSYVFEIQGLHMGENEIIVEVNTTLARRMNDFFSSFMPLEPCGITGASLEMYE